MEISGNFISGTLIYVKQICCEVNVYLNFHDVNDLGFSDVCLTCVSQTEVVFNFVSMLPAKHF